jgi:hypothetical protein
LDGVHLGGLAVEVDGDQGLGFGGDRGFDFGGVEVVRVRLDIDEDRLRPGAPDGPGGGEEGVRGGDDLITGADLPICQAIKGRSRASEPEAQPMACGTWQ